MRLLLPLFIFVLMFTACKDKNTVKEGYEHPQLVTGIELYDPNGASVGIAGNPNNNITSIAVNPIPARNQFHVSSQEIIKKFWILPGNKNNSDYTDFDFGTTTISFDESELNDLALLSEEFSTSDFVLDVSSISNGYYRVYLQLQNGEIEWANTYLHKTLSTNALYDKVFSDF